MTLRRREAIGGLALLSIARAEAAAAQATGKSWRIGVLLARNAPADGVMEAFREALRDLGYIEGRDLELHLRQSPRGVERPEDIPALAAELVSLRTDVIVTDVTLATRAAMRATTSIPIVMTIAADPVGDRLVSGLSRPGGNVTGVSAMLPDISTKRLQLLKELVPHARRIGVLWHPSTPWHAEMLRALDAAAPALQVRLIRIAIDSEAALASVEATTARESVDAVFVGDNPFFFTHREALLSALIRMRLPMTCGSREWAVAGSLMTYGPNFAAMFRRAAGYVDRIIKGARPADLPVEQPTKFEMIVNLRTARALSFAIPPMLLAQVDEEID